MAINYQERIPNNVDLAANQTLQRALEHWQPQFPELVARSWARTTSRPPTSICAPRSASIRKGWAHFGYVKMPDYRWGIFLADRRARPQDRVRRRTWASRRGSRCPGEYRSTLRRLIVTQGDTEPASVEQQRHLGLTAPRSTTCATCSRSTSRKAATCGPWSICCTPTSAATAAKRPRSCWRATRATPTSRASSARSTSRSPTGFASSCSPSSPTATASSS